MREYYFERLRVWQDTREYIKDIYLETKKFPKSEKFGVTSQMRRAAMSIAANIAEGMSRKSEKGKARFINIAYGSAVETLNFLILSLDLGYIEESQYKDLREKLEKITNQLNSLYEKLK